MSDELDLSEYVDGLPAPEIVEHKSGRVTVKGEEIPEGVTPVVDDSVEEPSKKSEPEEVPATTEEEKPVLSAFEQEFYKRGLDKQFKGGPNEMLDRVPEMNKYITRLERERALAREATPQAEPFKPPSNEEFYEKPQEAITKMIDQVVGQKLSSFDQKLQEFEYKAFVASRLDFNELEPTMMEQLEANPALKLLGMNAVPVIYQMAKAQQLAKLVEQQKAVPPSPDKKVATATTGKKTSTPPTDSPAYWQGKSLKEIEDEVGFSSR